MSTVASYFSLLTGSADRETETTVVPIRPNFFLISNLKGVRFADASRNPIVILDPDNCPIDRTHFTFRSVLFAITVDARAPNKTLSIEFSLRLPQNIGSLSPSTGLPVAATHPTIPASAICFQFGNYTDEILDAIRVDDMRLLNDQARITLSPKLPSTVQLSVIFPTLVSLPNFIFLYFFFLLTHSIHMTNIITQILRYYDIRHSNSISIPIKLLAR